MPTSILTRSARSAAKAIAQELLRGVGADESLRHRGPYAFHVRRRLSESELAVLGETNSAWCALPAIDVAGGGEPW